MKILFSLFLVFGVWGDGFKIQPTNQDPTNFEIITFEDFEKMMGESSSKLRVFNFWATWCAPCVKEMPYFEKVQAENSDIELIFISMDDGRKPERVTNFIERRNVQAPVYLLNDVDYNKWIDKVDPSWSGAIPATLFIKSDGSKYFHEGEVDESELKTIIQQLK
ncbi:TlpA family protein disulfide reductase [Mongoliitalea daihaiensis]|uniref:TlpA family protein disulfide reductase n=1 Tax=Mongoliitalea daihaiensis TaxID=2782006 RepID=UPI001F2A6A6C|nr:TlpA disulfide reductase family protein [Mongoliitalea daihaiensis]UJP66162.1 TlpA family protein disulfide reductase [Mongoliitalea daihaiensis]